MRKRGAEKKGGMRKRWGKKKGRGEKGKQ